MAAGRPAKRLPQRLDNERSVPMNVATSNHDVWAANALHAEFHKDRFLASVDHSAFVPAITADASVTFVGLGLN